MIMKLKNEVRAQKRAAEPLKKKLINSQLQQARWPSPPSQGRRIKRRKYMEGNGCGLL
jgi:hypothetical protein